MRLRYTFPLSAIVYAALVMFGLFSLNAFGEYDGVRGYDLDTYSRDNAVRAAEENRREEERSRMYEQQFREADVERRERDTQERLRRLEERQP